MDNKGNNSQKSVPKLIYFNFKAKAEAIRLAFYIGNIEFEDCRVSREEFDSMKSSLPFRQLPVLLIDGKYLAQSIAILYYAGQLAGLVPLDLLETAKVLQVLAALEDILGKFYPSFAENDVEKIKRMRDDLAKNILPCWLGRLNKIIEAEGQEGFCVGNKLTIADLQLYVIINWVCLSGIVDGIPTNICDEYKSIMKVIENVGKHPKVAQWNAMH